MVTIPGLEPPQQSRYVGGAELGQLSQLISTSHLSWHFDEERTRRLDASFATRDVGVLRLAWLSVNEWAGKRTAADIRSNPEPYLTVLMPLRGTMLLKSETSSTEIRTHELGMWDSTQSIAFELNEPQSEQISVLVPQRALRASPEACAAQHCARVDRDNVLSELCVQHMATLAKFLDSELRPYEMSLSTVTTALFDAVIASLQRTPRDRDHLINEIKDYIESYIADEELSPTMIASAFEISTRYVHKIFEPDSCTIGEWILGRRLDRSTGDLLLQEATITDIAFKWGFKDLGHYSRAFKSRFGVSPRAFRKGDGPLVA